MNRSPRHRPDSLFTEVPRCVLSGSCPQLLDVPLRTIQKPVDQERVGVSCYLRRDPGSQPHQRGGQSLAQAEDPLEAGDGDLYVLPRPVPPFRALGSQEDADLRQGLSQIFASVGQVSQERPRHFLSQSRLGEEFLGQGDVRDVGGGEFVGDGDTVGGAQEVQLDPVDAEGTPAYPPGTVETWRGCRTSSKVESTSKVSASPTSSGTISRLRGSKKRLSFLTLRCNEEG